MSSSNLLSLLLKYLFLITRILQTKTFSFDESNSQIFTNKYPDSYFGYALATYVDQGMAYIVVGSPKEYVPTWDEGDRKIGRGYRCQGDLSKEYACERIPMAIRTSQREEYKKYGHKQPNSRYDQWMGGAVSATTVGNDGYFTICAPRFLYAVPAQMSRSTGVLNRMWVPIGECLLYPGVTHHYQVVSPCKSTTRSDLGQCQAGFSASILGYKDDNKVSTLFFLTGLPGGYDGNGEIYVSKFLSKNYSNSWTYHKQSDIASLLDNPNRSSYMGYDVKLVNLRTDNPKQIDILTSRTMWGEANWKGSVSVMTVYMASVMHINDTLGNIGDIFGYSVTSADLNGDGVGDIIIGSPYYANTSLGKIDQGRVYIYYGKYTNAKYSVDEEPTILESPWNKGRFGHVVCNIGDIDDDGLDDIAVGCPYCGVNMLGEVYIYLSNAEGRIHTKPFQILTSEQEKSRPKTFGWSLAGKVDLDGNGYPDLIVGAYKSASIFQFRAQPVVKLFINPKDIQIPRIIAAKNCSSSNRKSTDCEFTISVIINLKSKLSFPNLPFLISIELDAAVKDISKKRVRSVDTFLAVFEEVISLGINSSYRFNKTLEMNPNVNNKDIITPIVIQMYIKSNWSNVQNRHLTPLLHPLSNLNITFPPLDIYKEECGEDNVCHPDLSLTLIDNINNEKESGVLFYGKLHEPRTILVKISNLKEPAYNSRLLLTMPVQVRVQMTNKYRSSTNQLDNNSLTDSIQCREDESNITRSLSCYLGYQLDGIGMPTNSLIALEFNLFLNTILDSGMEPAFVVKAELSSENDEMSEDLRNNVSLINYSIYMHTQMTLSGQPNTNVVIDERKEATQLKPRTNKVSALGQHFNHSFYLVNSGPSPVQSVKVEILVPMLTQSNKILVYLLTKITEISSESVTKMLDLSPRVLEVKSDERRGYCSVPEKYVNPLKLNLLIDKISNIPLSTVSPLRIKRNVVKIEDKDSELYQYDSADSEASTLTDLLSGKTRSSARENIACGTNSELFGAIQCGMITCYVTELKANDEVRIVFDGVLWADTLFSYRASEVKLVTTALATVTKIPYYLRPYNEAKIQTKVETAEQSFLFKGIKSRPLQSTPAWVIALAVILGILLLVIIIVAMWRCGFFERGKWKQQAVDL